MQLIILIRWKLANKWKQDESSKLKVDQLAGDVTEEGKKAGLEEGKAVPVEAAATEAALTVPE